MISAIDIGSSPDCDDLPGVGTRARLVLMNYDDVQEVVIQDERVVEIILKAGKKAYEFLGFRNDMKKSDDVEEMEGLNNRFRHNLGFVVYEESQEQKTNIEGIVRGRFMAITERTGKTADSLELLGKDVGLEIRKASIRDAYENSGAFVLSLFTPENGKEMERQLPKSFGTDYENGQEMITVLLDLAGAGVFDPSFDPSFS